MTKFNYSVLAVVAALVISPLLYLLNVPTKISSKISSVKIIAGDGQTNCVGCGKAGRRT